MTSIIILISQLIEIFILENSVNPELQKIDTPKKNEQKNDASKIIFVPSSYYPHKNLEIIVPITKYLLKKVKDFIFILTINDKDFKFKCCVGKNNFSKRKIEGDKKTPIGTFKIGNLFYRADRFKRPLTKLKTCRINKNITNPLAPHYSG